MIIHDFVVICIILYLKPAKVHCFLASSGCFLASSCCGLLRSSCCCGGGDVHDCRLRDGRLRDDRLRDDRLRDDRLRGGRGACGCSTRSSSWDGDSGSSRVVVAANMFYVIIVNIIRFHIKF